MPSINRRLLCLILSSVSLTGCQTTDHTAAPSVAPVAAPQIPDQYIPVQRYGRYTLVELEPDADKRNLLLQIIDIDLPSAWSISVGDALRYVLLRSGYQLCKPTTKNAALFALPLPAAHLKLGPLLLRDALQILAGPAWSLHINEQLRQLCFEPATANAGPDLSALKSEPSEVSQ